MLGVAVGAEATGADFGAFCRHDTARRAGASRGPLAGETFAVKCLFAVAGARSCYGNPTWLSSHPPASRSAQVIEALLQAGASLEGLTLTDELALSLTGENAHYGTPLNPRAPGRVPGGSSSGSAVAVASGRVGFALGSDTGGSVRVPASHTGIFGLRPTHGSIPLEGVLPLAPRFDTVGLFARSAPLLERASAVLLPVELPLKRPSQLVVLTEFQKLATGLAWSAFLLAAERVARALRVPLAFEELGPELGSTERLLDAYLTLQNLDVRRAHREFLEQERPAFGSLIGRRIGYVLACDPTLAAPAEAFRTALVERLDALLSRGVYFALPSAPSEAPARGLSDDEVDAYTGRALALNAVASLAGLPSLSLPLASVHGLPLGLSLIGPRFADRSLLSVARHVAALFELEESQ